MNNIISKLLHCRLRIFPFWICVIFLLNSCGVKKGVVYFEDIDKSQSYIKKGTGDIVYQPEDRLIIRVSSPDNIGVATFNKNEEMSYKTGDGLTTNSVSSIPYIVDVDGFIEFPQLGMIKVGGKTKVEIINELKLKLRKFINEPWVDIEIVSFRLTILGEVENPGSYLFDGDKINIIQAFGLAGDLRITGNRKEVLVLREEDGKTKYITVNLLEETLFKSEAFYLEQNDIVYVKPIGIRTREIGWETSVLRYSGIAALALSIISILSR